MIVFKIFRLVIDLTWFIRLVTFFYICIVLNGWGIRLKRKNRRVGKSGCGICCFGCICSIYRVGSCVWGSICRCVTFNIRRYSPYRWTRIYRPFQSIEINLVWTVCGKIYFVAIIKVNPRQSLTKSQVLAIPYLIRRIVPTVYTHVIHRSIVTSHDYQLVSTLLEMHLKRIPCVWGSVTCFALSYLVSWHIDFVQRVLARRSKKQGSAVRVPGNCL